MYNFRELKRITGIKYLLIIFLTLGLISCKYQDKNNYKKIEGYALGTAFHITYNDWYDQIVKKQIDSLIYLVNRSMSTYIPNSDISKINRGDPGIQVDQMFLEVFGKSKRIYLETGGYFDPTIGILVNAWGFGPNGSEDDIDSLKITELLDYVGLEKLKILDKRVIKEHPETYIDFNAIAKGYAVDVIGKFLEAKEVNDYLVEIGGEIRARGVNSSMNSWTIAIEKPNFDGSRSFQAIVQLKDESIATSGNYRKFKIDPRTGMKYAHTIDTRTGFPSRSNLLSASVISHLDCADVDAYATAFMAMGLKESKEFLQDHSELKAFLIYTGDDGEIKTFATENFKLLED